MPATSLHETRKLLKVLGAADRLNVSKSTVYNLMDSGELPWVKIGKNRRIPEDAIEALIARNTFGGQSLPEPEPPADTAKLTIDPACVGKLHVPQRQTKPAKPGRKAVKAGGRRRG